MPSNARTQKRRRTIAFSRSRFTRTTNQQVEDLRELDKSILKQIESFFLAYTELQGKNVKINGCSGRREAVKLVADAMQAFEERTQ